MALDSELDTLVLNPATMTEPLAAREAEWRELFGLELPTFIDARAAVAAAGQPGPRERDVSDHGAGG